MYKNLLLPLDLTNKHDQAIRTATELAKLSGGRTTLLHVIELIHGLPLEEDRAFYERLEQNAHVHLDKIGKAVAEHKIPWQPVILFGNRLEETVRFARDANCDLVIVTSPKLDPANPALGWGSLSFKISLLAPTPVLMVKE